MIGMDETTPVDPDLAAMVQAMEAEAVARGVVDDTEKTFPNRSAGAASVGSPVAPSPPSTRRDWLSRWEEEHDL